jgi:hypothetical protein
MLLDVADLNRIVGALCQSLNEIHDKSAQ